MKRNSEAVQQVVERLRRNSVKPASALADITIISATDDLGISDEHLLRVLSEPEKTAAAKMVDHGERRHFLYRRSIQRLFLADVSSWPEEVSKLEIVHAIDTAPRMPWQPSLHFSFSSSGATLLAGASFSHILGVDVENIRPIADVPGLSRRFFTPGEADYLESLPTENQNHAFLQHWTAKEAGLKAMGKGIVSGLNTFSLVPGRVGYVVETPNENGGAEAWNLDFPSLSENHVVAVIHRPRFSG